MSAMSWLLGVGLTFLSIIVMVSSLFVPAQQKEKSRAFLGSEEVYYFPPRLSHEPPPGRSDAGLGLAAGGTSFMRIMTRGVRFDPDGVTILGPRRFGIVPNHFIIPTRDPQIRARIRAWADEHRIPVSGQDGPPPSARTAAQDVDLPVPCSPARFPLNRGGAGPIWRGFAGGIVRRTIRRYGPPVFGRQLQTGEDQGNGT
jgi:hypothetical protein